MIATFLASLIGAVETVTSLSTKTGMSVGGVYPDPTTIQIPLPACWVLYGGRVPTEKVMGGVVPKNVIVKDIFIVMIYLDNTKGQKDMETNQLPILEQVVASVRGLDTGAFRFAFEGERLQSVTPAKLTYEQRYSVIETI